MQSRVEKSGNKSVTRLAGNNAESSIWGEKYQRLSPSCNVRDTSHCDVGSWLLKHSRCALTRLERYSLCLQLWWTLPQHNSISFDDHFALTDYDREWMLSLVIYISRYWNCNLFVMPLVVYITLIEFLRRSRDHQTTPPFNE